MPDRPRLADLLPDRLDDMAEQVRARLCEDEQVGGMKLAWDYVGRELHGSLAKLLDRDLIETLAGCWAKATAIRDAADPARHPPGERTMVALGDHQLSRSVHPVVAVTIAGCPCVELKFEFKISAAISGVRLSIADGHLVAGDLGEAWASGNLSFEGIPLHPEAQSRKLALSGPFDFAPPGIAIPR